MSLTILEVLENAQYNLDGKMPQVQLPLAKEQLSNAIKALENGYDAFDDYDDKMLTVEKTDDVVEEIPQMKGTKEALENL